MCHFLPCVRLCLLTASVVSAFAELQGALQKKPKKTCIVKMVRTRNLWKNIVVLCVNS